MKGKHFVYYDRAGKKQVDHVKHGNPYRNADPITAFQIIGYMSKSEAEALPDYNSDYDISEYCDINGYAKTRK